MSDLDAFAVRLVADDNEMECDVAGEEEVPQGSKPPPPPLAGDKNTGRGRGGKGGGRGGSRAAVRCGKGFKQCKGCQQNKPESSFAINQAYDTDCKKFLDNISKAAKAAGPAAVTKL